MSQRDQMSLKGKLKISLNGVIVQEVNNLVVSVGHSFVASRITGDSPNVMSHMAIGSGTTAATLSDGNLETEIDRIALTTAGGVAVTDTVTFEATWPANDPNTTNITITEAGLFNDATVGTMLARTVFPQINKGDLDTLAINWEISLA